MGSAGAASSTGTGPLKTTMTPNREPSCPIVPLRVSRTSSATGPVRSTSAQQRYHIFGLGALGEAGKAS